MRDPVGNVERYDEYFQSAASKEGALPERFAGLKPEGQVNVLYRRCDHDQDYLLHQYCAGVSLDEIAATLRQRTQRMLTDAAYVRTHGGEEYYRQAYPLSGIRRNSISYLALALLLIPEIEILGQGKRTGFARNQSAKLSV
ncbi:hypothetical protein GJ699_10185 [Duganella sp. FT80W]|uniref:Uncharacterized protein n=1 Tax=Duganella guangzhouensis TaxID=2666084 RepID=A0A6I2L0V8_9BURK|nr:hypothetical protein [Duganella guangzhouensis]MRW90354.1 hypothetical protein [Duganella guangzhouensis]